MRTINKNVRGLDINFAVPHPLLERQLNAEVEPEILDFIDTLTANDCLIDMGAAEGRFALYAARKGIITWAIEPDKHNFATLEINRRLNNMGTLNILNIAIGSKDGTTRLRVGQPYPGGHQKIIEDCSSRNDLLFHFSETQEVNIIKYDTLINDYQIKPSALKIDIDGSELDFFKGANDLSSVKQLMIELCTNDPNYQELTKKIAEHGFQFKNKYSIPNEKNLYNIWFTKKSINIQ